MKCYCINLDERKAKWKQTKKEAEKLRLKPIRFSAIKTVPGWKGCRDSHLEILDKETDQIFIIIEDDIKIHCENPLQVFEKALSQLPDDWDMLYLGATLNQRLATVSENLHRLKAGWTTHGIVYNNQNGVTDFILENREEIRKIDVFYAEEVQYRYRCYLTNPMILTQRDGYSDIRNKPSRIERYIDQKYKQYMG